MNTNIKKMAQNRLNTTKLGRLLKRVVSEESGQGAMEYVVIATLIAAAVAVGVWLFGSQILGMFQRGGDSVEGRHDVAEQKLDDMRNNKDAADQVGKDSDNKWTTHGDAHGASAAGL